LLDFYLLRITHNETIINISFEQNNTFTMSTSLITKKKRKPFGTRDGNVLILRKTTSSGVGGEKSKTSKTNTSLRKQGEKKKEEKKRPRNSKTPKTSNLTATAGAYNLSKEFAAVGKGAKQKPSKKVVRGGGQHSTTQRSSSTTTLSKGRDNTHRSSTTTLSKGRDNTHHSSTTLSKGRDPSPIKRPDPSSNDGHLKMKHHNNKQTLTKSTKEPSSKHEHAVTSRVKTNNGKDGFVAASLKRLFPSSKEAAKKEPTRSKRKPCTTPEQVSPLITSPLNKPDPPLNGKDDKYQAAKPTVKKSHGQPSKVERSNKHQSVAPQKNNRSSGILKEADNKRVLEAMLSSGPLNNNREVDSVIGSIVGGESLQRSYSIDGSEVTALDDVENESQASMTTCGDRLSVPTHRQQKTNNVSDIFRTKVQPTSNENDDSKKSNIHQELRRANTINSQAAKSVINTDQPTQHQQQPIPNTSTAIQLPSGWKTRWSKTKQKPYYVHPDFGATWHCPGLKSTTNNQHDDANAQRTASTQYQQSFRETNTNHKEDVPFESTTNNTSQGMAANLNQNLTGGTSATSSKCFTQDFESNDGAVIASSSSIFNDHQSDELEIAVQRAKQRLMQDEQGEDLMVGNVEEEPQYNRNGDDPIEFHNDGGGGFDADEDVKSQEQLNAADPPTDDEDTPEDDDQHASVLDTIDDELNSLSSDHIDVDALLQNGRKEKTSPLSTIKELRVESAQSKQSSQVSLESEEEEKSTVDDDNDLAGLGLLQKDSTLSPGSDDVDKSVAHHEKDDDDNHSSPMLFDNNGGFEDEDDDVVSNGDVEEEIETLARQSTQRNSGDEKVITGLNLDEEVKKESKKGPKKKIFPPGKSI